LADAAAESYGAVGGRLEPPALVPLSTMVGKVKFHHSKPVMGCTGLRIGSIGSAAGDKGQRDSVIVGSVAEVTYIMRLKF
jgi:hypothetical protein